MIRDKYELDKIIADQKLYLPITLEFHLICRCMTMFPLFLKRARIPERIR